MLEFNSVFQASFAHLGTALNEIPSDHYAALAGLGADQLTVTSSAIAMSYNVRIGIEDNIWWDEKRSRQVTNIDLVKRTHELLRINQKEFMTPQEFGAKGFYNRKRNG